MIPIAASNNNSYLISLRRRSLIYLCLLCCLVLFFVSGSNYLHAENQSPEKQQNTPVRIALLQPSTATNPRSPFYKLAQGIISHQHTSVTTLTLNTDTEVNDVSKWLKDQNAEAIVSLGRQGHKLIKNLDSDLPKIAGGIALNPNGMSGLSLCGDPALFFQQLKLLAPQVERVSIVYNEKMNGWWVQQASAIASEYKLTFQGYPAPTIRDAVAQYKKMILSSLPEKEAIWIPLTDIVPAKTILPLILKAAWARNLVVLSNNPLHAKQGALFSLYPNNESMGYKLAEMAISAVSQPDKKQVLLASDLLSAINRRTAAHLGIKLSTQELEQYDRIYPSQ